MKKRHTPEQIVRKLREADALLSAGASTADMSRKLGVSETTYPRRRRKYEGMAVQELKKLKVFEQENARLKAIVAEQAVGIRIPKEVAEGTF